MLNFLYLKVAIIEPLALLGDEEPSPSLKDTCFLNKFCFTFE